MKAFFSFIVLLCSLTSGAQANSVKLYGYAQPVISGIPPAPKKDESGNTSALRTNYLIYAVYPKNQIIYLIELWLKGEVYGINAQPVTTPVQIQFENGNFEPEKITLIPSTGDTCLKLGFTDKLPVKNTTIKKSFIENNDLVLVYRMKGKIYLQTLKRIKGLRAATLP